MAKQKRKDIETMVRVHLEAAISQLASVELLLHLAPKGSLSETRQRQAHAIMCIRDDVIDVLREGQTQKRTTREQARHNVERAVRNLELAHCKLATMPKERSHDAVRECRRLAKRGAQFVVRLGNL